LTGKNFTVWREYSGNGLLAYTDSDYKATVSTVENIMGETTRYFAVAETLALEKATQEWAESQNHH
jgi:DNA-binding transcriptional regulator YbjK